MIKGDFLQLDTSYG